MKCTKSVVRLLGGTILCLLAVGCARPRPEIFPDTDIVYQSADDYNASIGFVNADGSNNIVLPLDFYPVRPTWSADGKTLYYIKVLGDWGFSHGGYVSYWQEGEAVSTCWEEDWWNIMFVMPAHRSNPQQVIMFNNSALMLVDLKSCREMERYVDLETLAVDLFDASLSSGKQLVTYTEATQIIPSKGYNYAFTNYVLDLNTSRTTKLGEGIYPTISPDHQWIAYTDYDGIYVVTIDGSQHRRVVEYNVEGSPGSPFEIAPPEPRWSPDGQWLIYHKCIKRHPDNCHYADEFSIFKVEVATGVESKIVNGGVYPYWRWRESAP